MGLAFVAVAPPVSVAIVLGLPRDVVRRLPHGRSAVRKASNNIARKPQHNGHRNGRRNGNKGEAHSPKGICAVGALVVTGPRVMKVNCIALSIKSKGLL